MRRLIRFIFQLVALVIVFVALTTVWVIVDGVTDVGDKADVALFAASPADDFNSQLDRVAKYYKDGETPAIILCEPDRAGTHERFEAARKYLTEHGVANDAIVEEVSYLDNVDMAGKIAQAMKTHGYSSIMLMTDYYRITRMKIVLGHEGVMEIRKRHLGWVRGEDVIPITTEVVALYDYISKTFLLPAAEKIKDEAKVGADKVQKDAEAAKKKVDKGLDDLPK